ncbi:hypothetical protein A2U01_0117807, partial [Trifolium medium]|nr:hypothetical protein [Trifolium medium]
WRGSNLPVPNFLLFVQAIQEKVDIRVQELDLGNGISKLAAGNLHDGPLPVKDRLHQ